MHRARDLLIRQRTMLVNALRGHMAEFGLIEAQGLHKVAGLNGREFAAWLGLVPRQNSTGGKARLGGISKRGDSYLRRLLVNSAHTVLLCAKVAKVDPWIVSLRGRKPRLVVAVALANKTARVAWAVMSRQDTYRRAAVPA
jgi:transposase